MPPPLRKKNAATTRATATKAMVSRIAEGKHPPPIRPTGGVRDIDGEEANLRSGVGDDDDENDEVASSSGETTPADSTFKRPPPPTGDGEGETASSGVGVGASDEVEDKVKARRRIWEEERVG